MVDLAAHNAKVSLNNKFELISRDESRTIKAIEELGTQMGIQTPIRIEAFDNSNIQGVDPVSAMVTFVDGKPDKKNYRKYKIKTVQGPDDYKSMREVVRRRYTRVLNEGLPLPDLIIVDGGKGHMNGVIDVLQNELGLDIPVAGLQRMINTKLLNCYMVQVQRLFRLRKIAKHFIYCIEFKMKSIDSPSHSIDKHDKRLD